MQIKSTDKIVNIGERFAYIDDASKKAIQQAAVAQYGDPWDKSIGDVITCLEGDFSCIGMDVNRPEEITAAQYGWVERFKDFKTELENVLTKLEVPGTPESKQAEKVCISYSFREAVLIFCRRYFELHNFADVLELQIGDYILAKKDVYNTAIFERKVAEIHERKMTKK